MKDFQAPDAFVTLMASYTSAETPVGEELDMWVAAGCALWGVLSEKDRTAALRVVNEAVRRTAGR